MSIANRLAGKKVEAQEDKVVTYIEPTSGLREIEITKLLLISGKNSESVGFSLEGIDTETGAKINPENQNIIKRDGSENPIGMGKLSNIFLILGLDFGTIRTQQVQEGVEEIVNVKGKKIKVAVQLFKVDPKSPDDKVWDTTFVKVYNTFSPESNKSAYEIANGKEAEAYKSALALETIDERTGKTVEDIKSKEESYVDDMFNEDDIPV